MHEYNYDVNINARLGIYFFQKKNVNNYLGSTSAVCYFMNIQLILILWKLIVWKKSLVWKIFQINQTE